MTFNRKVLLDLAAMLAIGLIVVAGYQLSPLLLARADVTLEPLPGCDLHRQACAAVLPDGGRIELAIAPRPIPLLVPLRVEVRLADMPATKVEVDFAGVDMNMGHNRPVLAETSPGLFRGEATLPVCVTGRMAWRATVQIETPRRRIAIPFRFDSVTR